MHRIFVTVLRAHSRPESYSFLLVTSSMKKLRALGSKRARALESNCSGYLVKGRPNKILTDASVLSLFLGLWKSLQEARSL